FDLFQDCVPRGRRERIPSEGTPVMAELEQRGCITKSNKGADGNTAGDPLGDRNGIRSDSELLKCEPRSCARNSGLNLINDEKYAVQGSELTRALNIPFRKFDDARIVLDGFQEKRGDIRTNDSLARLNR